MAKNRLHTQYRTNKRVPSVTTVINNLGWNKNALINWAKNTAAKGIDPDKVKAEAADIGTLTHHMVESHIKGVEANLFMSSQSDIERAQLGYNAFLDWEKVNKPKYLNSELKLVSSKYNYGGTLDLIVEIEGKRGVLDLKTSKWVYKEHIIQLGAYLWLYEENVIPVDFGAILKLDKVNGGFEYHAISLEKIAIAFEVFLHCLELHRLKGEMG